MQAKDTINLIAIVVGPILAVIITLWYQSKTKNSDMKREVFYTLMKYRNSIYMPAEYVAALNSIDFVFHDQEKIKAIWGSLYDNYRMKDPDFEQRNRLQIDLLYQIAKHLRYSNLTEMQINKFYTPQLHADDMVRQKEISDELLRLLKASEHYGTPRKNETKI